MADFISTIFVVISSGLLAYPGKLKPLLDCFSSRTKSKRSGLLAYPGKLKLKTHIQKDQADAIRFRITRLSGEVETLTPALKNRPLPKVVPDYSLIRGS